MKKTFLAILVALATITASAAQPTEQSIEELLSIVMPNPKALVWSATRAPIAIYAQTLSRMANKDPSPNEINDTYRIVNDAFEAQVTWEKLRPDFVRAYRTHFTQEEVNALITFFKGPVGQSWLREMPSVSAETQLAIDKKMKDVMESPPPTIVELLQRRPNALHQ